MDFTGKLDEAGARALDAGSELASTRERFLIPPSPAHESREAIYLCGNSLGLQPKTLRPALLAELDDWGRLGVEGHFHGKHPWFSAHEPLRAPAARLVGAEPHEVVVMNSLTVNLHLLMASFFRPEGQRTKILIDAPTFPSDVYAVKSQLRFHGLDPAEHLLVVGPRDGEHTLRTEDVLETLEREGDRIALLLLGGVNYYTGQLLPLGKVTSAAQAKGCVVGVDLAHAAGNAVLKLHEWGVDFAAWCNYKYINSGPGALGGAFVHERHLGRGGAEDFAAFTARPRFEGWWGNEPESRFQMGPEFVPVKAADAWQLSNPPILALTPVRVSLELFEEIGIDRLREKSLRLTGYLEQLLDGISDQGLEVITPRDPDQRGCQLSILAHNDPEGLHARLQAAGVICDFRRPNVIRVAPVPLYNTFLDCYEFAEVLRGV
ncbi:MAG: kynureninase [Planctomycetes bacterium]|nr:kynureninase [Planctomycetota bacterium]